MLTEFALFQKPEDEVKDGIVDVSASTSVDGSSTSASASSDFNMDSVFGVVPKDICCSRITRLYNDDGSLKQGSTSFFILKPLVDETMMDDTSLTP